ncbi:MAG: YadA-like family protein, partial [Sphingomonadaceae bacterium]|nr:YadA-like family protein [Sphingomonadaceae bacterium]
ASGRGAQAFGWQSRATGNLSLSAGHQATASGVQATAVGKNAVASGANSTAIGFGATATVDNQVVLGGTGSSVRVGDITASTAAQAAASVGVATVDANGVLGRNTTLLANTAANTASIATLQGQTATLFDLADVNRRDIRTANEGVAMALAMDSPSIPDGANYALSGGFGYFQKRTAFSSAVSARVGEMSAFSAGIGVGLDSGEVGGRAGFQVAW